MRLGEAIKKITLAIKANPSKGESHVYRGSLYRRTFSFNEAIDDFLMAVDKSRSQPEGGSSCYHDAQQQLLLTYNDFAVYCYKKVSCCVGLEGVFV